MLGSILVDQPVIRVGYLCKLWWNGVCGLLVYLARRSQKFFVHFKLALLEAELCVIEHLPNENDVERQILWSSAENVFEMLTKIVLELMDFWKRIRCFATEE